MLPGKMRLEEVGSGVRLRGLVPGETAQVLAVQRWGEDSLQVTYSLESGATGQRLLYRDDAAGLEELSAALFRDFLAQGREFKLASEALRLKLAHLVDPLLAVHSSAIDPLPHQITAVYERMLPQRPLHFLLADDPGAGKTITAGLLLRELMARSDVQRCLIVCPGNLIEQWLDELSGKFSLAFRPLGEGEPRLQPENTFDTNPLAIASLDKLARDEVAQEALRAARSFDLVLVDEAHKMSASYFSEELRETKRYRLGKLLASRSRQLLLLTATPHNGKEADFQLLLALLDPDRFEGRYRAGVHTRDASDLIRRVVKEQLYTLEGKRLFPERKAETLPYSLSGPEEELYQEVTAYVREQFNQAERIANKRRAGMVGFALTVLQRRLASSPEAIYQSLRRRRERLSERLEQQRSLWEQAGPEELDIDALEDDLEAQEGEELVERASAATSLYQLEVEVKTLQRLETLAAGTRSRGSDSKWRELAELLQQLKRADGRTAGEKLIIFTEHRDTLAYLQARVSAILGEGAVLCIQGGLSRAERSAAEQRFRSDPLAQVLIATDAAGEGINLQEAHLMVNYDLPWNPNRIEQRFGRIHRIGQRKPCYLWNLVASDTREGEVYRRLLEKLEEARKSLGGQVFDVLGELRFGGKPLRELLIEAVRYGNSPQAQARLDQVVEAALDQKHLSRLLKDRSLLTERADLSKVADVRSQLERADASRPQPHYLSAFFLEAFRGLGGQAQPSAKGYWELSSLPAALTHPGRQTRYLHATFDPAAARSLERGDSEYLALGHPLVEAVIRATLERHQGSLERGAVLVDTRDPPRSAEPRLLVYLLSDLQGRVGGQQAVISSQLSYLELEAGGVAQAFRYAPYLDYRPLEPEEPSAEEILSWPECTRLGREQEQLAMKYAVSEMIPEHLAEVRTRRTALNDKVARAVRERLTKEVSYWDNQVAALREQERAGKKPGRISWQEADRRATELSQRRDRRLAQLELEREVTALPPKILGAALVVPSALLAKSRGAEASPGADTAASAALARELVMEQEQRLGFEPVDRELERLGYDIESRDPETGELRFLEVKGRREGARTITLTRNEILFSLNEPERYILAMVSFGPGTPEVRYLRDLSLEAPDFLAVSVNYDFDQLFGKASSPS